jgi:hypothetical protein
MKCANTTCNNNVLDGESLCASCRGSRDKPEVAPFPLQQGARDIQRLWYVTAGAPLQRSASELLPDRKRKRSIGELKRTQTIVLDPVATLIQVPILFVPFEGNFSNRIIGGYERTGNQTATLVEGRNFDPFVQRKDERITGDMASTVGNMEFWAGGEGDRERMKMLAKDKGDLKALQKRQRMSPQSFYEAVVEDRLTYLGFEDRSGPEEGRPEVIVLSERLLEFPDRLWVLDHEYLRWQTVEPRSPLQHMAAYVLSSVRDLYQFDVVQREGRFNNKPFEETWLLVKKGPFTLACVHLSSRYTSAGSSDVSRIFATLYEFAQTHQVHAILGDFNLNTFGVHGGVFAVSGGFGSQSGGISFESKFATSSGSGDKCYMGGMICDPRVFQRPTLTSLGSLAVPPWFTRSKRTELQEKVFSDHHSLYGNYLFRGEAKPLAAPRNEAGGDCFFVALKARLARTTHAWGTKCVLKLREAVINGIAGMMGASGHLTSGRFVNVQVSGTGLALPVWCNDLAEFIAQMREPGRWVDDTILPFIAALLQMKLVVTYGHGYAEFETTGVRNDRTGRPPLDPVDGTISMNCQGNHYW